MKSCFQYCNSKPIICYQADQWSTRLGDECKTCNKKLTHQKCISLCRCYYFCHEKCFKQQFQKQIYDQSTIVKCQKCNNELQLQYAVQFKYQPSLNLIKGIKSSVLFFFILIFLIAILVTLNSDLSVEMQFLLGYIQVIICMCISYEFVLSIRSIIYLKIVKISGITSTKLDIETSAFKDIQLETNDQFTKQCFEISNKK